MRANHGRFDPLARDAVDAAFRRAGDDLVAALAQNGDDLRADQPGAADDDDLHRLPPLSITGASQIWFERKRVKTSAGVLRWSRDAGQRSARLLGPAIRAARLDRRK